MKYEVIELATGARMAHTATGQLMGTTLFDSFADAQDWMTRQGLNQDTHSIKPAK